jgi:hypothetical protein
MKRVRQAGFSIVELLLVVVFVAAIAGVGYVIVKRNSDNKTNTATVKLKDTTVPSAPAVTKTSDLTKAEQTLDNTNVDAGAGDATKLDTQMNDL